MYFSIFKPGHFKRYSSASSLTNFMQERDRGYTPAWSIFCLSHIWVESVTVATRQHDLSFAYLTSVWRPMFRCARSFSTLRVQVVLRRSFGYFHSTAVSLLPPEKLSDNHPLGEAPATWSNKYNWFICVMSSDKKTLAWNRTCWCKLHSFFNSEPFLTIIQSSICILIRISNS